MSRLIKNIALIAVSSVFTLLLAEFALHLAPGLLPVEIRQAFGNKGNADTQIGNLPAPNSTGVIYSRDFESPYRIDDHGFRNTPKWPETNDIVAIGDSLVFGYGVDAESAWPQILENKTGKSVLNLGLIGAAPQQYRKVYESFGRAQAPELLIVGFFARNDFWDAEMYANWRRSGDMGNYLEWRGFGTPTADQLQKPWYRALFFVRKHSYVLALSKLGRDAIFSKESPDPQALDMADGNTIYLHQADFVHKTSNSASGNDYFNIVVETMRALDEACKQDGTRLVVVLQPAKEEVYRLPDDDTTYDATKDLRIFLESVGIDYIDAGPAFRKQTESGRILFFPTDGHPNSAGYKLISELLLEYITQLDTDS